MIRAALTRVIQAPLLLLLVGYQRLISPLLPPACRFYPSCSEYSRLSILRHGPLRGVFLTARRLARCHPWQSGGIDWPPDVHGPSCGGAHEWGPTGSGPTTKPFGKPIGQPIGHPIGKPTIERVGSAKGQA